MFLLCEDSIIDDGEPAPTINGHVTNDRWVHVRQNPFTVGHTDCNCKKNDNKKRWIEKNNDNNNNYIQTPKQLAKVEVTPFK